MQHAPNSQKLTCPMNHDLLRINDLYYAHHHRAYKTNKYSCNGCSISFFCKKSPSNHCIFCQFDLCPKCFDSQPSQKIFCTKGHPLFRITAAQMLKKWRLENYRCKGCEQNFVASKSPPTSCDICQFDLCPGCSGMNQSQPSVFYNNNNGIKPQQNFAPNPEAMLNYTKIVTCENSHPLVASNCLSQMRAGWTKSYTTDLFVCNACSGRFDSNQIASHHCNSCQFDMCPGCYEKSKNLNFNCILNHPLYSVSSLKQFNKSKGSYVNNRYVCNTCKNKFEASNSPSTHCKICSFDLCPTCCYSYQRLIAENVQKTLWYMQQQQQQQNVSYQNYNYGNSAAQDQKQLYQEFDNLNIQNEPVNKFAPPQENNKKQLSEEISCIVCLNSARTQLFTPCMHLCTCEGCSADIVKKKSGCPICRVEIQGSVKVYMS